MAEKTEAQKRAQQRYMDKFVVARVRLTREEHEAIRTHAIQMGESLNEFAKRSMYETMERDKAPQAAE